ncbi:hypothetical protein K438DRAFT_759334 [Mycena galopus ATCC 62051]|nr:hypothetical protein K438DRAFT_759334 [Mycena galopus ATCC 62051]
MPQHWDIGTGHHGTSLVFLRFPPHLALRPHDPWFLSPCKSGNPHSNLIHPLLTRVYHHIPDFREIAAGDLILKDLRLDRCGAVTPRQVHPAAVRRMYSAAIYGNPSPMTVAVYDGQRAKESWMEAISRYSRLRHPNVLQLFGTTKSAEYYTAIFHDAYKLLQERSECALWTFYFQHFLRDGFRVCSFGFWSAFRNNDCL